MLGCAPFWGKNQDRIRLGSLSVLPSPVGARLYSGNSPAFGVSLAEFHAYYPFYGVEQS